MTITVESFNGHDLNGDDVRAWLDMGDSPFQRSGSHVVHRIPGRNPVHVRTDPEERLVVVHMAVAPGANINDTQRTLQAWFEPGTEGSFIITEDGVSKALDCVVSRFQRYSASAVEFTASLVAYTPEWRSASIGTTTEAIVSDGQSWSVTNVGDAPAKNALITLTPTSQKAASAGWRYRQRTIVVPRTDYPHNNRAFDITDGGLDHAALVSAGKSNADGSDIRVLWNGVEQRKFWFGEHADNDANSTATKIWTAANFGPQRTATLYAAITATGPADGDDLEVVRETVRAFSDLEQGALLVDSEVILFNGSTHRNENGRAALEDITRGAWGSTAATHSAGATVYWVAGFWDVLYGYSAAATAYTLTDLAGKPMLNLTSNTLSNTRREWADFLDDVGTGSETRPESWRRRRRALDEQYDRILTPRGNPVTALTFEYQALGAQADKPNFNEYYLDFPSGTGDDGSSNILSIDRTLSDTMALVARMVDGEGEESTLATYSGALTSSVVNIAEPATPAYEVSFQGRSQVVWSEGADALATTVAKFRDDADPTPTTASQSFVAPGDGTWSKTVLGAVNASVSITVSLKTDDNGAPGVTIVSGSIPSGGTEPSTVDHTDIKLFGGQTYWVQVTAAAPPSAGVNWTARTGPRPNSTLLIDAAEQALRALMKVIAADCDEFDDYATADDGDQVIIATATVYLDAATVPLLLDMPEEEVYVFDGAYLENESTGQRVTFRHIVCSIDDEIQINVRERSVINITTGEELGGGIEFSDSEGVFEIDPGVNTLSWHESGVDALTVEVQHFARYV